MKGYAGREKAPPERLTVGPGQHTLLRAIEQVKIAQTFLEARTASGLTDTAFLRVDPFRYGVNFVSHRANGDITSFTEVGALPVDIRGKAFPVVYPAAPFLGVPTRIVVQYPVILVCRFNDALAWAMLSKPSQPGFNFRVGTVQLETDYEEQTLVVEIPAEKFQFAETPA